MTRMTRCAMILLSSFLLSACSQMLTSKQKVDKFYTLNATHDFLETENLLNVTIIIEKPQVAKGLDSTQIMLMRSPQRLDYYAGARWSMPLSKMVQLSLIESFENSELLSQVITEHGAVRADYALFLDVYDFQAEYANINEPPVVHIKLVGKLVTTNTREIVASFTSEVFEEATENNLASVIATYDDAFQGAQSMLITEVLDYVAYTSNSNDLGVSGL